MKHKNREAHRGSLMPEEPNELMGFLDAYCNHLAEQGRNHHQILRYKNPNYQLVQFLASVGIKKPKEVTEEHLKAFQQFLYDDRDFAHGTIMTFMRCIALFFSYLIEIGKLDKNIARGVEIFPKPTPQKQHAHFYTFEEIIIRYLRSQEKYVSFAHLNNVEKHIRGFFKYLRSNEIGSVYPVTEAVILKYREFLWSEFVNDRKDYLVVRSQVNRLRVVVRLFRYLTKEGILKSNPTLNLSWEDYYKGISEKAKSMPKKTDPAVELSELEKLNLKFLEYQRALGKEGKTLKLYKKNVEIFFDFLAQRGIENISQVNKRHLLEYYTYICNYVGVRGKPASSGYKSQILWSMRLFFRFLTRFDYVAKDPSLDLEGIKEQRGLPRTCMNEKEVFELIARPSSYSDPLMLRDRAMMELLFSTGIRSNELCNLNIEDVDGKEGMVRVNFPKGGAGYQRVVPIGKVALETLEQYLKEGRTAIESSDVKALFLSYTGRRIDTEGVLNTVKKYAHQCGFRKNITPHSFRVTCATLMLKNGADIRYVQEQLGHKRITSTQVYTRLAPKDLKGIHRKCHPRERKVLSAAKGASFAK